MKLFSFWVEEQDLKNLKKLSKKKEWSLGQLMRKIIKNYLKNK